ncbi:PhoX family phosphatase [Streptomyces sp. DSM 44915]|uniref:PhoX family phosphatase n=1 Tax=Streptomyces chisholmiae TaxID=3075540 RepID=A0ABU2JJJ0_9ACTN|nr:PhoX family phosphatase [Streptomyces sp. DSM 44915]MDT0265154.1 PhoX family phosphatase [Streptomyces sp. DSM 44915]
MSAQHPVFPEVDPDDVSSNSSDNQSFGEVVQRRMSRRNALLGGTAAAAAFLVGPGLGSAAAAAPQHGGGHGRPGGGRPGGGRRLLGFEPVGTSDTDEFLVPDGYQAQVLIPWGTPIRPDGPAWRKDGGNTAEEQAEQIGMNHDGMHFFPLGNHREGSRRGLLVLNHEYIDQELLFPDGPAEMTEEKVRKALAAHGVSVVEIERRRDGSWERVDSRRARRVTGDTPVEFSGPVSGDHPALRAQGRPRGTLNNCSHGVTPWGTYLACEENWNNYFGTTDESWQPTPTQERYGVSASGGGFDWHLADSRFDLAANPNEINRFGWIVEIDPQRPRSAPVKRTALGRVKHEGCTVTESRGRVVAYTGDDQDGDYIYKFVGEGNWRFQRARGRSPLDHGTLYVATFQDDGRGRWLPLVFGEGELTEANGWQDQADVLLRTREAADAVGATKMDRPEWITINPKNNDVYCTLTNGSGWGNAVNPRDPNPYGHIVRWSERNGDHTATTFEWDIFVLAGDPAYDPQVELDEGNRFGSPDGVWFDPDGRLWIQTDVSNSSQHLASKGYDNIGNNQMLAADPETGEIRRFLTGPRGCEITGATATPDQRTLFVNVQHPGESTTHWGEANHENPRAVSNWPDFDPDGRPRSATVAITRLDGGKIGA